MTIADEKKALICFIANLLKDCRHVAVGASSPIPGAAALLGKAAWNAPSHVNILGSTQHNFFTNGSVELFDCAAQGRIDAFFLGGGEIDGQANINLMGMGDYPNNAPRWPGTFGSAYLYYLVPKVILFREEHTRRVLVDKVNFISSPGTSEDNIYRTGGPYGLLTNKAFFRFDREARKFRLQSIHPSSSLEDILDNTGFEFDYSKDTPITPAPDAGLLNILETEVREKVREVYPQFAESVFAPTA
ncbi:CoA-transferase [Sneathiella chinensis]|uniref:CoA synthetase n=1 Tax=Sneathiella chinensis TaxID=349750 RepID=A0ABQ5U0U0_9PROT|nr:CoA-transferase [Sneathiella chinensis]GLQ05474.1 CoA synthetase [Sneathiella chinensis]